MLTKGLPYLMVAALGVALGLLVTPLFVARAYQIPPTRYLIQLAQRANCDRVPAPPPAATQFLGRRGSERVEVWVDHASNEVTRQLRVARGATGDLIIISDTDRSKSSFINAGSGPDAPLTDPRDCTQAHDGYRLLRREPVLGNEAVAFEKSMGAVRIEIWRLPAAHCAVVQMRRFEATGGKSILVSAADPVEIKIGATGEAMFVVPPDYREVAPSTMAASRAQRDNSRSGLAADDPRALASVEKARLASQRLDESYQKRQAGTPRR